MRTGAVIVATGRPGYAHEFRPLMRVGNVTVISRIVSNLRTAGINDIVLVTGYRAEELEKELRGCGVTFLKNKDYATSQMFDFVKIGLEYMKGRVDRIIFCPGGVSFFYDSTIRAELDTDAPLVIPSYNGRAGHPILIRADLISEILRYRGDRGLKGALDELEVEKLYIKVNDKGTIVRPDSEEDLRKLEEVREGRKIRPTIKLQLADDEAFFGPGPVTLFRQIDRLGSVREACEKTGISYSKGWKIISRAETALDCRLVERQQGGKNGGKANLTENCRDIVARYEQLEEEIREYAGDRFREIFGDDIFCGM